MLVQGIEKLSTRPLDAYARMGYKLARATDVIAHERVNHNWVMDGPGHNKRMDPRLPLNKKHSRLAASKRQLDERIEQLKMERKASNLNSIADRNRFWVKNLFAGDMYGAGGSGGFSDDTLTRPQYAGPLLSSAFFDPDKFYRSINADLVTSFLQRGGGGGAEPVTAEGGGEEGDVGALLGGAAADKRFESQRDTIINYNIENLNLSANDQSQLREGLLNQLLEGRDEGAFGVGSTLYGSAEQERDDRSVMSDVRENPFLAGEEVKRGGGNRPPYIGGLGGRGGMDAPYANRYQPGAPLIQGEPSLGARDAKMMPQQIGGGGGGGYYKRYNNPIGEEIKKKEQQKGQEKPVRYYKQGGLLGKFFN